MLAQETWINQTENYQVGDSGIYEPFTDDIKRLFKAYQRDYGRCVSKVYIDNPEGVKAIGWVFEKTMHYEDTHEPYLQHTWITLHDDQPIVSKEYKYHYI